VKEIFVLPEDRSERSGGNLYNRLLLAALRREGLRPAAMTLEQALRHARSGRAARYWIDSLLLPHVAPFRTAACDASECYLVLHYFPSHDPAFRRPARNGFRRTENAAFAAADGFLVTSRFSAAELAARGVRGKPVMVVEPAPTLALPTAPRARNASTCRVLMVANVTPGKGMLEFLRGLERHLPRTCDFSLEIAGRLDADRAYMELCRARVERSAALRGRVRWLGALGAAALRRAYARNAIFVSASHVETFGMALQEARCAGLYLLTLPAGNAASHVVSPSCGEVLPSIDAIAARVATLASDPAMRLRLLRRVKAPRAPTWHNAAQRFLAQLPRNA
jgi:glycosyltransferase involved in cell wall biosynthesis